MPGIASPEKQALTRVEQGKKVEAQKASAKVGRAQEAASGVKPAEATSESEKLKAATADKTTGDNTESKLAKTPDSGTFQITDWTGYPEGNVPKPEGPFRIIEGQEYEDACKLKDVTNRKLHKQYPERYDGLEIHEIHPVKWGGSPTDVSNKVALEGPDHDRYTAWWRKKRTELTKS